MTKHTHVVRLTGTTSSGSWIASASLERRKTVSPPRGASRSSRPNSAVKTPSAIGAFQLRMTAISGTSDRWA